MALPYSTTKNGYEVQLQTNHLAPYLLTTLLVPVLKKSDAPRIVFVSSVGHYFTERTVNYIKSYNNFPSIAWTWFRYGRTKLANIHTAAIISEDNPEILSISVHPGLALRTGLLDYWNELPLIGWVFKASFSSIAALVGVTNEQGSYATLRAALDPVFRAPQDNNRYLGPFGILVEPSSQARSQDSIHMTKTWTDNELRSRGLL